MTTESKHEKSDLTVHLYRKESLAIKLKDMYETGMGDFASNLFSPAYLTKHKVPSDSAIEVKYMAETVDGECAFELSVKGGGLTKDIATKGCDKITPINGTFTLKLPKNNHHTEEVVKRFEAGRPYHLDGYWWSIKSVEIDGSEINFILNNPCEHFGEWELIHKPTPKVNEMQGLLNHHRKQPDIVYIAGAISGDVVANRHRFAAAKHSIMASSTNTTVLNPAELPGGLTQTQYMSICLPMVMMSTSLFMLKGWEKSEGAIAEHALALKLKIEIVYQGEHDGKL